MGGQNVDIGRGPESVVWLVVEVQIGAGQDQQSVVGYYGTARAEKFGQPFSKDTIEGWGYLEEVYGRPRTLDEGETILSIQTHGVGSSSQSQPASEVVVDIGMDSAWERM